MYIKYNTQYIGTKAILLHARIYAQGSKAQVCTFIMLESYRIFHREYPSKEAMYITLVSFEMSNFF